MTILLDSADLQTWVNGDFGKQFKTWERHAELLRKSLEN